MILCVAKTINIKVFIKIAYKTSCGLITTTTQTFMGIPSTLVRFYGALLIINSVRIIVRKKPSS